MSRVYMFKVESYEYTDDGKLVADCIENIAKVLKMNLQDYDNVCDLMQDMMFDVKRLAANAEFLKSLELKCFDANGDTIHKGDVLKLAEEESSRRKVTGLGVVPLYEGLGGKSCILMNASRWVIQYE